MSAGVPFWGPEPPAPAGTSWRALMLRALRLAGRAARSGEVPVGALVVNEEGRVLAEAHNETERLHDPTAHAEVLALRRASAAAGNHRLGGCVLVVTLEPCLMCTGAGRSRVLLSRRPRLRLHGLRTLELRRRGGRSLRADSQKLFPGQALTCPQEPRTGRGMPQI